MGLFNKIKISVLLAIFIAFVLSACGGSETEENNAPTAQSTSSTATVDTKADDGIGVGPIKNIELGEIDEAMVAEGMVIFENKCSACHKVEARYVGPPVKGVTERRKPEWIMNMILNPEVMVKEDPQAKALLAEYLSPMANQNLTEDEARAVLEYFRTLK